MENTNNTPAHVITYDEVSKLRKSGNVQEAYDACVAVKASSPETQWVNGMMGWCLYDMLKGVADADHAEEFIKRLQELVDLNLAQNNYVIKNICWPIRTFAKDLIDRGKYGLLSDLLAVVSEIEFDPKDENYSILLDTFIKAKDWSDMKTFIVWWGYENLKEKDYQPFVTKEGLKIMSVAEQAYIALSKIFIKEIETSTVDEAQVNDFVNSLRKVAFTHEEMQYPPYFLAKILMAQGKNDEAEKALLPFVAKKKNDYWVWDCLGDIQQDKDMKLSCYCKAMTCRVKDSFLCKLHLKMCNLLISLNRYDEARTELHVATVIYKANGWHFPDKYLDYFYEPWYTNAHQSENNVQFYKDNMGDAELLVYSEKPREVILVTHINKEKQIANFITIDRRKGFFSYKKLPKRMMPKLHGIYDCRMELGENEHAQVYICTKVEKDSDYENTLYKKVIGKLKVVGSGAGFVDDIYIHPSKIAGMHDGQTIECMAYPSYDKMKLRWGWSAEKIRAI